jgi:uncharacterized damage-inducible protein DinB
MSIAKLSYYWKRVREDLLATIDKFDDQDLSFVPYEGAWSVGELMLHIAHEEEIEILHGIMRELKDWPSEHRREDYATVEAIKSLLTQVHIRTEAYLSSIEDRDMDLEMEAPWGKTFRQGDMIWHTLEHEIHHRGELSLILGMIGREGLDA